MRAIRKTPPRRLHAGLWLAIAGLFPLAIAGQSARPDAPKPHIEPRQLSGDFPHKPSIPPTWTIPVDSVGFAAPGELYLGQRNTLTSLNFLDENHLLFTFRVPALLRRSPGAGADSYKRQIRAVVLSLPSGAVDSEANWLLHDRSRYLWMLHDGHFLLRDRNSLMEGDASLNLKPYLKFPGPLLTLELDPNQQYLVTSSREPVKPPAQEKATAAADNSADEDSSGPQEPDLVLRILHRDSGDVMLVSRVRDLVHVPLNSEGYIQNLRGDGVNWMLQMNDFGGGNHPLGKVKSACMPQVKFVSDSQLLATACADMGSDALVAMNTRGDKLWIDLVPDRQVWPVVTVAPNGQRIARETLYVSHSISAFAPLGNDDIKGQWLQVLDSATGHVAFESPVTPILDAGGNVALAPSGRRVAVLIGNTIQVFELPPAPPLPQMEHSSR